MPLARRLALAGALVAALGPAALAQEAGEDRFFFVAEEAEAERKETAFDGSLTSTSFFYTESGGEGDPYNGLGTAPTNASPVNRLFTDLRAQLDAKHVSGSKYDVRADARGRLTGSATANPSNDGNPNDIPFQSGLLHGNELELREFYLRRDSSEFDWAVGRQYTLELAAVKFDGIKIERTASQKWRYIGFAGLYPTRGSRDIREDYPVHRDNDPDTAGDQPKRIMPVAGGVGAAYRYERAYGSFGAVAIAPLANDLSQLNEAGQRTGTLEKPRVFATSTGYWRQSMQLDFYHYAVVDAYGAAGAGITNLTLGLNWQPVHTLRTYAQVSRIDTETLNVQAQTKLEDPDVNPSLGIQNNVEVARISQDAARVGVSASLRNRFEISTSGALRRRPELTLQSADGGLTAIFPAAQAADITIAAVDRRSWKDLRIGLSGTRSFPVGDANVDRARTLTVRGDASRTILGGRAEVEGNVTFLQSRDDNLGTACNIGTIATCYGASRTNSISLGGLLFYRFKPAWYVVANAALGRQSLTTTVMEGETAPQGAILTAFAFLRLAHRF
jgi:hypothetical protein